MSETVQQLIDKALVRPPRKRSGKFNPSSFGMCFRAQYWNRKDEPKSNPPDDRAIRVFKAGELFHEFVQDLIIKQHEGAQTEVEVETDDVKGRADILTETEVIELKSQHSKSFWWMKKKGCDIRQEKYSNWLQVMYYARELKKEFGRLVFISKDDLCIQEYVQPLDEYWRIEISNELAILRSMWLVGELPPALPRCTPKKDGTYWMCNYCNYLDLCKETEKKNNRVTLT